MEQKNLQHSAALYYTLLRALSVVLCCRVLLLHSLCYALLLCSAVLCCALLHSLRHTTMTVKDSARSIDLLVW